MAERTDAERTFQDAFSAWEVLPDERVLATAGTEVAMWPSDRLSAVVNVASFVRGIGGPSYLDLAGVRRAASLAITLTDLAAWTAGAHPRQILHPRVGIVGFGDALVLLRMPYGGAVALRLAAQVAQALLVGAAAGSIEQARRYGGLLRAGEGRSSGWMPELPPVLRDLGHRVGLRHATLTAMTPHPQLAMLANGVADGIDPARADPSDRHVDVGQGARVVYARGYAQTVLSLHGLLVPWPSPSPDQVLSAVQETADIMQPWIDDPIVSPLLDAETSRYSLHRVGPTPHREEVG